jgi:SET domain-containing protein
LSEVEGAGYGLFARGAFEEGDTIDIYDGALVPYVTDEQKKAERDILRPYGFLVEDNEHIIDAASTQSCIARYINNSEGDDSANCVFRRFKTSATADITIVTVETLRPITAGEELLVDYGKEYKNLTKKQKL